MSCEKMETYKPNNRCNVHVNDDIVLITHPEKHHYGRWNCSVCEKFVTWAQRPKTSKDLSDRQSVILDLMMNCKDRVVMKRLAEIYSKPHLNLIDEKWLSTIR